MSGNVRQFGGDAGERLEVEAEHPWKPDEAAAYLRVAGQTLARWRSEGAGPTYFKIHNRVRYWPAVVRQWARDQDGSEAVAEGKRATPATGEPDAAA